MRKFITTAEAVKRILEKDFLICFKSTDKNRMYNNIIKKISIKLDEIVPREVKVPSNIPDNAAMIIIIGCNFPMIFMITMPPSIFA